MKLVKAASDDDRRQRVAHLGNDPEVVLHCPFCGSGALTGGPDGSVTCSVCENTYIVFIQPQFSGMPADQAPGSLDPAAESLDGAADGLNTAEPFDPEPQPIEDISQAPPFVPDESIDALAARIEF